MVRKAPSQNLSLDRDAILDKGGLVSADKTLSKNKWKNILIRFPSDMIDSIDGIVNADGLMTRTSWILQTIKDKLKRNKAA